MSSVLQTYAARMLQVSSCFYLCLSANAWAAAPSMAASNTDDVMLAVPQKMQRPPRPALASQAWWLSAGIGAAHVSTYNAVAYNLGLYGSTNRFVYGLRINSTTGNWSGQDIRYGREQAIMLGSYLDARNMSWAGIGVSRVDGVGGRHPDRRDVGVGLPMEFVFSPPGRYLAPEIRFNVDLNKMNSFMMLTIGARFGQLK